MTEKEKFVFDTILARRSVRRFIADRQVEKWKIVKMLEAAMAAPSACNTQPWEFIVISETDSMNLLRNAMLEQNRFNAPMAIITCANPTYIPWEGNGWMIDCSVAVENMLIAATAMGLVSVWIGICHEDILRETFGIPGHLNILGTVYFGYTDAKPAPGTRYAEDAVYWETYDPNRVRPAKKVVDYGSIKLNDLSVNPPAAWED